MKKNSFRLPIVFLLAISTFAITYFWSEYSESDSVSIVETSVNQEKGPDQRPTEWAWVRLSLIHI